MNKLPEVVEAHLRELVERGFSCRQMAAKAGVSKDTAMRAQQRYRHLSPVCEHAKPLYTCAACINHRRLRYKNETHLVRTGPRQPYERVLSTEELLIEVSRSLLDDRR